jgi:hypothetical protein
MPLRSQKRRSGAPIVSVEVTKRLRLSQRSPSPREALGSQATESPSEPAWETQSLESQHEAEITAPTESSHAGTGSIADDASARASRSTWKTDGADHFDGISWERLKQYMKPVKAPTGKKSWIYQHGYHVVKQQSKKRVVCMQILPFLQGLWLWSI